MATLGTITPEWDPPYDAATILDVERCNNFDVRAGGSHVWAAASTPRGKTLHLVASGLQMAIFTEELFILPVRVMLGAQPAVSLRDFVALICRDSEPALEICREARDLLERRLRLYPDPASDTLLPMVPMGQLRHVCRILAGLLVWIAPPYSN